MQDEISTRDQHILAYIYNAFSDDMKSIPMLDRNNLLIPPLLIDPWGWQWRFFTFLENRPLSKDDVLPVHCFYDEMMERYYDEYYQELPEGVYPCGNSVACGYRTIDALVSKAMGIPPANEGLNLREFPLFKPRTPQIGDVFAMQVTEGQYIFGRIVNNNAKTRDMNLRILKPSRRKIRTGDIFVLHPIGKPYVFGRVIRTDAKIGFGDDIMIYIYKTMSTEKDKVPPLSRDDLLVPPVGTYKGCWSYGIFETVDHRPVTGDDILPVHCFCSLEQDKRGESIYYDDNRNRLPLRIEPCGHTGVTLEPGIDEQVSGALGMPLARLP